MSDLDVFTRAELIEQARVALRASERLYRRCAELTHQQSALSYDRQDEFEALYLQWRITWSAGTDAMDLLSELNAEITRRGRETADA